jgi:hypothetical protein
LLTDGSSDDSLRYPIDWLLRDLGWLEVDGAWADLRSLRNPPRDLPERVRQACFLFPCDLLMIHRDAENEPLERRISEIEEAATAARRAAPHVCVVPVRMVEAWLLHDESAIRRAAGNPNGTRPLDLPDVARVEELADPKTHLRRALLDAVADRGRHRRRAKREFGERRRRVAELITNYSPLRQLEAFASFERRLVEALTRM